MSILDKFNLSGKTALVTGARRGIGMAMAVALSEAGADIVATSAGMEAESSAVAREVAARGRKCLDADKLAHIELSSEETGAIA